jgi:hypothetical protein
MRWRRGMDAEQGEADADPARAPSCREERTTSDAASLPALPWFLPLSLSPPPDPTDALCGGRISPYNQ